MMINVWWLVAAVFGASAGTMFAAAILMGRHLRAGKVRNTITVEGVPDFVTSPWFRQVWSVRSITRDIHHGTEMHLGLASEHQIKAKAWPLSFIRGDRV